jgi:hypothetical protein
MRASYTMLRSHRRRATIKKGNLQPTRSLTLLPAYAKNFLTWSVTSRPIAGGGPTIDLVIGYHKANRSDVLKLFLSRVDHLAAQFAKTHEDRH